MSVAAVEVECLDQAALIRFTWRWNDGFTCRIACERFETSSAFP
jgi:hypothetical protein